MFDQYDAGNLDAEEVKSELANVGSRVIMEALNWRAYADGITQLDGVKTAVEQFLESILNFNLKKEVVQESLSDVLMAAYNGELDLSQDSDFYNFFNSSEIDRHALDKEIYAAFKHIFEPQIDNIAQTGILLTKNQNSPKSITNLVKQILEGADAFDITPPHDILLDSSLYILDLIVKKVEENKVSEASQISVAKLIINCYKELKGLLV